MMAKISHKVHGIINTIIALEMFFNFFHLLVLVGG